MWGAVRVTAAVAGAALVGLIAAAGLALPPPQCPGPPGGWLVGQHTIPDAPDTHVVIQKCRYKKEATGQNGYVGALWAYPNVENPGNSALGGTCPPRLTARSVSLLLSKTHWAYVEYTAPPEDKKTFEALGKALLANVEALAKPCKEEKKPATTTQPGTTTRPGASGVTPGTKCMKLLKIKGEVEVIVGGAQTVRAKPGQIVCQYDRIYTGEDASAVLQYPDGSTVIVHELTDVRVSNYVYLIGVKSVKSRLLLLAGELDANIKPHSGLNSDFRIKTPTATCSIRGTRLVVHYDKDKRSTVVFVKKGTVRVIPANKKLKPRDVRQGQRIEVTRTRYVKPAVPA